MSGERKNSTRVLACLASAATGSLIICLLATAGLQIYHADHVTAGANIMQTTIDAFCFQNASRAQKDIGCLGAKKCDKDDLTNGVSKVCVYGFNNDMDVDRSHADHDEVSLTAFNPVYQITTNNKGPVNARERYQTAFGYLLKGKLGPIFHVALFFLVIVFTAWMVHTKTGQNRHVVAVIAIGVINWAVAHVLSFGDVNHLDWYLFSLLAIAVAWTFVMRRIMWRKIADSTKKTEETPDVGYEVTDQNVWVIAMHYFYGIALISVNLRYLFMLGTYQSVWLLLGTIIIGILALLGSFFQAYEGMHFLYRLDNKLVTVTRLSATMGRLQPTQLHERASMLKNSLNLDC